MDLATPLPIAVVLVAVLIAAATDLRAYKVYNALTLPLLVAGLIYHGIMDGTPGLGSSLLGMLVGLGYLFPFFLMGGMGGGDVKLMAGVGAWLGVPVTFLVLMIASLAGGIHALFLILARGRMRETWSNLQIIWCRLRSVGRYFAAEDQVETELERSDRHRRVIPFASMIALGVLAVVVRSLVLNRP